jgi:hypothetical protein
VIQNDGEGLDPSLRSGLPSRGKCHELVERSSAANFLAGVVRSIATALAASAQSAGARGELFCCQLRNTRRGLMLPH